jgi:hypothetical protein
MDPKRRRRLVIVWALTTREPTIGSKKVVICQGVDREEAKRVAKPELGGNPDTYIVQPLTTPEDSVVIKLEIEGDPV